MTNIPCLGVQHDPYPFSSASFTVISTLVLVLCIYICLTMTPFHFCLSVCLYRSVCLSVCLSLFLSHCDMSLSWRYVIVRQWPQDTYCWPRQFRLILVQTQPPSLPLLPQPLPLRTVRPHSGPTPGTYPCPNPVPWQPIPFTSLTPHLILHTCRHPIPKSHHGAP